MENTIGYPDKSKMPKQGRYCAYDKFKKKWFWYMEDYKDGSTQYYKKGGVVPTISQKEYWGKE